MKENKSVKKFGPGYKNFIPVREVQICPVCASPDPDICLEELPTERFRFERCGEPDDPNSSVRIRSDVSMLLHAADMAKKYGQNFVQSMIDSKHPKSSPLQELMDKMSDDQILDTLKSRHLQSPSELISWSEYLVEQAKSLEGEAARLALDKKTVDDAASAEAQSDNSQSE